MSPREKIRHLLNAPPTRYCLFCHHTKVELGANCTNCNTYQPRAGHVEERAWDTREHRSKGKAAPPGRKIFNTIKFTLKTGGGAPR